MFELVAGAAPVRTEIDEQRFFLACRLGDGSVVVLQPFDVRTFDVYVLGVLITAALSSFTVP